MNLWTKILLIGLISIFIFACDENDSKAKADIEITNHANFDATVWIFNLGYSPVTVTVPGNQTKRVTIEDGDAGLNVEGGRAIVEYAFSYLSEISDDVIQTNVDLSTDATAFLDIDNDLGCLVVQNYSTNEYGNMWINIDYGPILEIAPWADLIKFYDPFPSQSVDVYVEFEGFTLFSGGMFVNVEQDVATIMQLEPDACGIWVENNSLEYITAVYISPSSSSEWGYNQLSGTIYPGDTEAWRVDADMWDVKITTADGYDSFSTYNDLDIDDILIIDYSSRNDKNNNSHDPKLDNIANHNSNPSNSRIELVN